MVGDISIDPLKQMLRQRCVEANLFSKIGRDIEIDDSPHTAFIVRVVQMVVDGLAMRQRITVGQRPLTIKGKGFKHIVQCLFNRCPTAETARGVWHGHAVIGV